jgi:hypothetical protein
MFRYPKLGGVDATLELLLWSFFQDAGFATNFGMTAEMFFRSVTVKGKRGGQGWQERRTRVAREEDKGGKRGGQGWQERRTRVEREED